MHARQIMASRVISVTPEQTVFEAVNLMLRNHVSGLPVVDRAGNVVGMISESDFLRRAEIGTPRKRRRLLSFIFGHGAEAEDYVHEHGRKISEIMKPDPITIDEKAPLSEIVDLMEHHNIKRIPVVDAGKLVGIVSRSNLLQALASLARDIPDPTADDDHIRERIVTELEKHDWCPIGLHLIVRYGIVHLSGVIMSEDARAASIVAAENVPGVVKVHDHLCSVDTATGHYASSKEDEEWASAS